ncbi:hypothetical protein HUE87_03850 [Candidatus Sulfurimonas marisnigri]|uniref:Curli production assembly/transport component CsgG n=1 Tax=Candidatus Sulfurimonas marisnigri TaxID=2740405 RepID=A0A7S7M1J4_9BACT|nr:DUF6340 family protein [Candidatus Sulfurimonas marisnigri]QOY55381.1 hypothetical protein HUE87_03850 [Candidatus Sulfurimonas marisnigri]
MNYSILVIATATLLISGCAQKATVLAIQPAEVDRMASTKKVAVSAFSHDIAGLSNKIEVELAGKKVDGKNYFTTISRSDINKVLEEQRLQNSGLFDDSSSVKMGKLLGAQALISGNVSVVSMSDKYFYKKRTKCSDDKCKETYEYSVRCTKREMSMSAQMKIVDVQKGDIIYAETISREGTWKRCVDDKKDLPSKAYGLNMLADEISGSFVQKLVPYYATYKVLLLDEPDLEYSDMQEDELKYALEYIKYKRYDKAEELLSRLLESTSDKSYVAAYNLAIIKEVQGDLMSAKQLCELADSLTIQPVEAVDLAILRINQSISSHRQAQKQIQQ